MIRELSDGKHRHTIRLTDEELGALQTLALEARMYQVVVNEAGKKITAGTLNCGWVTGRLVRC